MLRLTALLALFLVTLSPAQARDFKIATIAPEGTVWMKEMRRAAEIIFEKTEGRVRFRYYPGGVMGNDKSVLRKIRIGQLQGGALTSGGLAEILPDSRIYGLPLAFRSFDEVDHVRRLMDGLILDGLLDKGFVSFGLLELGFAYLMSDKPLRRAEDLKGQKVWVPEGDPVSEAGLRSIGVAPVPLPLVDVLTGLETGLVDTVAASPVGAIALQWHTRVSTMSDVPLSYLYGALIINRRTFERLSKPDQALVHDVISAAARRISGRNRTENREAREVLFTQGIEIVHLEEGRMEAWHNAVNEAMDELSRNKVLGRRILVTLRGHLADYRRGDRAQR